jgi:hypothetical protein
MFEGKEAIFQKKRERERKMLMDACASEGIQFSISTSKIKQEKQNCVYCVQEKQRRRYAPREGKSIRIIRRHRFSSSLRARIKFTKRERATTIHKKIRVVFHQTPRRKDIRVQLIRREKETERERVKRVEKIFFEDILGRKICIFDAKIM